MGRKRSIWVFSQESTWNSKGKWVALVIAVLFWYDMGHGNAEKFI